MEPERGRSGEVHWLDPEEQRDWRAAVVGMTHLLAVLSRDLELTDGLSLPEYEILVRLSESGNWTLRMSELASSLAHTRSRVTHTVSRLESRGLVRRQAAQHDGRGVEAVLTERGYATLDVAAPHHLDSVRHHLIDVVTREQLAALGGVMREVLAAAGSRAVTADPRTGRPIPTPPG